MQTSSDSIYRTRLIAIIDDHTTETPDVLKAIAMLMALDGMAGSLESGVLFVPRLPDDEMLNDCLAACK